jgi:hypothetical protein
MSDSTFVSKDPDTTRVTQDGKRIITINKDDAPAWLERGFKPVGATVSAPKAKDVPAQAAEPKPVKSVETAAVEPAPIAPQTPAKRRQRVKKD